MSDRTPSVEQFEIYIRSEPLLLSVLLCFELIITWYITTFHCFVILKFFGSEPLPHWWLTTERFQNNETVKGGYVPSKNKFKNTKNNKLRWLAADINFKLLHSGCPIARGKSLLKIAYVIFVILKSHDFSL